MTKESYNFGVDTEARLYTETSGMTAKRFTLNSVLNFDYGICDYGEPIGSLRNICELLNELHEKNRTLLKKNGAMEEEIECLSEENERLKSEINMLKITIARNEAYIERITHKGEWSNTSDEEKEVIAYLQAYHQGDVKEIRK